MLDLITSSNELTTNVSSYLQKCIQYPVDYTYNKMCKIFRPQIFTLSIIDCMDQFLGLFAKSRKKERKKERKKLKKRVKQNIP